MTIIRNWLLPIFMLFMSVTSMFVNAENDAFIEQSHFVSNDDHFGKRIDSGNYIIDTEQKLLISFSDFGYTLWHQSDLQSMTVIQNDLFPAQFIEPMEDKPTFRVMHVQLLQDQVWVLGNNGLLIYNFDEQQLSLSKAIAYSQAMVGENKAISEKAHQYDENTIFFVQRSDFWFQEDNELRFIKLNYEEGTLEYLFSADAIEKYFEIDHFDPLSKTIFDTESDIKSQFINGKRENDATLDITRWQIDFDNKELIRKQFPTFTVEDAFFYFKPPVHYHQASTTLLFLNNGAEYFITIDNNDELQVKINEQEKAISFVSEFVGNDQFYTDINQELIKVNVDWQQQQLLYSDSGMTNTYQGPWDYELQDYVTKLSLPIVLSENFLLFYAGDNFNYYLYQLDQQQKTGDKIGLEELPEANIPRVLPNTPNLSVYEQQTNDLFFLGLRYLGGGYSLYHWQLNDQTGKMQYQTQYPMETVSGFSMTWQLIGKNGSDVYFLMSKTEISTNDKHQFSVQYKITAQGLEKVNEVALTSPFYSSAISMQAFMANSTTMVVIHQVPSNDQEPQISICDFTKLTCENRSLPDSISFIEGQQVAKFYPLKQQDKYLFVTREMSSNELKLFIVIYNAVTQNFEFKQQLDISNVEPKNNVFSFYAMSNGKELFINGHYFYFDTENSLWQASDISNVGIMSNLHANSDESFFVDERGKTFAYSAKHKRLVATNQSSNFSCHTKPKFVSKSDHVIAFESASSRTCLASAEFANQKPVLIISPFEENLLPMLQDQPLDYDFSDHILNLDKATVEVNHAKLDWQSPHVTGVLNNEDMFLYPYNGTGQPSQKRAANTFSIEVFDEIRRVANIQVQPTNVNDAPILKNSIEDQVLNKGEAYVGEMYDLVRDPDRDPLTFSFSNLPPGMTGSSGGRISGTPSKSGEFKVSVNVTDPQNSALNFDFNMKIKGDDGAGGGSLGYFYLLLLSVLVSSRRNSIRHSRDRLNGLSR